MKVFSSVLMDGGNKLFLTTAMGLGVETSERKKKIGSEGCIWSESFPTMAGKQGEWITDGKVLRAGVSAVLLVHTKDGVKTIMSRFDDGHPTAAGKLSPPAGVWDGDKDLLNSALNELGEEVIVTNGAMYYYWSYNNHYLSPEWVNSYFYGRGIRSSESDIEISLFDHDKKTVHVFLDGKYQGQALLAYEPENGGIEFMFLFLLRRSKIDLEGSLRDGEKFKDTWLNRQVGLFSVKDLINENKTTKAEEIQKLLQSL